MDPSTTATRVREHARAIFAAGVAAVEPAAAVRAHLTLRGETLHALGHRFDLSGQVVLLGMGKASAAMAQAVERLLGARVRSGVVATKYHHGVPLRHARLCESGHPVPDAAGVHAGELIEQQVQGLSQQDLVIVCLSGGASALVVAPRNGISLADKQTVAKLLLGSGADITAINTVRKKLSRLKGGGLARACAPARVLCLAISDVIGDDWSIIGSGPTSPDPSTFSDAWAIVERFGIRDRLPTGVRALLQRGCAGDEPETLKGDDPICARVTNLLLASNRQALAAASAQAAMLGYEVIQISEPMQGEAHARGTGFAQELLALSRRPHPCCLIAGGETTVVLGDHPGQGGRNQEFALAAALALEQQDQAGAVCAVLAAGTDGTDGPTDAAGGVVDAQSVRRAHKAGFDAGQHLRTHDAHPLLSATGDLLMTGPSGTNVMDLAIGISLPASAS